MMNMEDVKAFVKNSQKVWFRGLLAAAISGAANGIVTGFAAIGVAPEQFNLTQGVGKTFILAGVSALMSAVLGLAMYLKQSPLPPEASGQ